MCRQSVWGDEEVTYKRVQTIWTGDEEVTYKRVQTVWTGDEEVTYKCVQTVWTGDEEVTYKCVQTIWTGDEEVTYKCVQTVWTGDEEVVADSLEGLGYEGLQNLVQEEEEVLRPRTSHSHHQLLLTATKGDQVLDYP